MKNERKKQVLREIEGLKYRDLPPTCKLQGIKIRVEVQVSTKTYQS